MECNFHPQNWDTAKTSWGAFSCSQTAHFDFRGSESRLADCGFPGWGNENCHHNEDASVTCGKLMRINHLHEGGVALNANLPLNVLYALDDVSLHLISNSNTPETDQKRLKPHCEPTPLGIILLEVSIGLLLIKVTRYQCDQAGGILISILFADKWCNVYIIRHPNL